MTQAVFVEEQPYRLTREGVVEDECEVLIAVYRALECARICCWSSQSLCGTGVDL
jgi:hypothetical protein